VTLTFTIAIFVLGFAAFAGGMWMRRVGPRKVALTAGTLYGLGVFLASFSSGRLWWLYASYGLMGGIGLGLGYIVPVATLVKWFPDKRVLITGIAVTECGTGALITAPIATRLVASVGALETFAILGVAYFVAVTGGALFMQNPPEGYRPPGWSPMAIQCQQRATRPYTLEEAPVELAGTALTPLFLNHSGHRDYFLVAPMAQGERQRREGGEPGRDHLDRQRCGSPVVGVAVDFIGRR
jgi:OFA family oxalate/formate antiporter-like MFS transporter